MRPGQKLQDGITASCVATPAYKSIQFMMADPIPDLARFHLVVYQTGKAPIDLPLQYSLDGSGTGLDSGAIMIDGTDGSMADYNGEITTTAPDLSSYPGLAITESSTAVWNSGASVLTPGAGYWEIAQAIADNGWFVTALPDTAHGITVVNGVPDNCLMGDGATAVNANQGVYAEDITAIADTKVIGHGSVIINGSATCSEGSATIENWRSLELSRVRLSAMSKFGWRVSL